MTGKYIFFKCVWKMMVKSQLDFWLFSYMFRTVLRTCPQFSNVENFIFWRWKMDLKFFICLTLINSFNTKERSFWAGFLIAQSSDIELSVDENWTILAEPFWRSIVSKCLDRVFHFFLGTFLRQKFFLSLSFFRHGSGVSMFIWCRQTPFPIGMRLQCVIFLTWKKRLKVKK